MNTLEIVISMHNRQSRQRSLQLDIIDAITTDKELVSRFTNKIIKKNK